MKKPIRARRTAARSTPAEASGGSGEPRPGGFPIVGVGASAGGLEAFSALLRHLPLDTGMGFVLVQHLDPLHDSALTDLLGRVTALPVREVTHKLRIKPNHVYVIPPNTNLSITGGVLMLRPRPRTRTPHRSIDRFFETLAEDQHERAIGVVLSGTATDGTLGLEAIKAEGGITFAQDDSARYDSMPRSAVAAGCVDFVLAPEYIAHELARIARHPSVAVAARGSVPSAEADRAAATAHADDDTPLPSGGRGTPRTGALRARAEVEGAREKPRGPGGDDGFKKILLVLRNHCGVDFSLYKSSTIQRRVTRRMILSKHDTLEQYAQFLRGNTKELDALYSDTLISVTSFFRNPETFDVLQRKVLPTLLQQPGDEPLRVWTLGCSTGQEAYSIAMAFVEAAEKAPRLRTLQVFATDLNEALLDKARHGLYAKGVAQDLSPERLRRFFVEEEGGYRVNKGLREMVIFARQNVISDAPFSRMDLISCRNLLIYFEPGLQKKVFPVFHYALKPGGFLYLGASESIGGFTELFEPVDKKHKIYVKKAAATPVFQLPARKDRGEPPSVSRKVWDPRRLPAEPGGAEGFRAELTAQREADRVTVNQFAPPAVLVNAELQILQFRGPTSAYLEPPTGKASFDVLKMARSGLMLPLRATLTKAKKDNKPVRKEHVRIEQNGTIRTLTVEVIPLKNLRERCFLIVFEDDDLAGRAAPVRTRTRGRRRPLDPPAPARRAPGVEARRIAELETELAETRDYLQSIQEQHEAANEELQASNEEVQSANEELQSINEELETSKEELESANEELTTVNEEMGNRNTELNRLNSDLTNIQTSAHLAIVLLGRDLTIRRFSLQAEKQFNLLATDVGRPISSVRHPLDMPDLDTFITDVIDTVQMRGREVQNTEGRWFSLRVRPYLTLDNKVDGAVLVLVDINDLKRSERAMAAARDYAEAIIRTARDPFLVLNADLRVETANEAFYRTFHMSAAEAEGHLVYELGGRQWNIPRLRDLLEEILPSNGAFDHFEVTHDFERLGRRTMLLNARRLSDAGGQPGRILLGIQDLTDLFEAQAALRQNQARYQALVDASAQIVWTTDAGGAVVEDSPSWRAFTGQTVDQWRGFGWLDGLHPDDRPRVRALWERAVAERTVVHTDYRVRHVSGGWRWVDVRAVPVLNADGGVREWVGMNVDVTARKGAEDAVRESEVRYRTLFAAAPMAVFVCDRDGVIQQYNRRAAELWGREPVCGEEKHCGSVALRRPDGTVLPHAESPIVDVLRTGVPRHQVDVLIERPDGSQLPVLVNIEALKNARGDITGAITSFIDITERKRAEETLRESDRHKNEFLAMLAHELRNPLAPIWNAIEILRRAPGIGTSPATDVAVDVLGRQVGQMVRLVDDLLDAGRISRGKITLRRERVALSSVVDQAVDAARLLAQSLGHELTVTVPREPVYVDADPTRLAQIVGNLLNNACKFTARGGHVWLSVEREDATPRGAHASARGAERTRPQGRRRPRPATSPQMDAPSSVVIRVRDTGLGLAADQLPRIFDMFTQLDTSLERSVTGLGIGLTLVRTLAELHGGTVDVRSAGLGHGSEFVVQLPILDDAAPLPPHGPPPPPATDPTTLRILVVDDNEDGADILVMLLQLHGHETHVAHDGVEAVDAAARLQPDVVLLDIGLPGLNGYQAARRIRDQQRGRGPVLVAVTGWGQEEDRRRSEAAGFDAHIVKPVDHVALMKLLGSVGAGARPRDREPPH